MSEVDYHGYYDGRREVGVQAKVQTLRTDDYARTFQTFKCLVDQAVSIENRCLYDMGSTGGYMTPKIAYGNREGSLQEHEVPS